MAPPSAGRSRSLSIHQCGEGHAKWPSSYLLSAGRGRHHPPSNCGEVGEAAPSPQAPSSTLRLRGGWGGCAITHPPSARRGRHHPPSDCREVGEAAPSPTLRAPGGGAIIHPPIAGRLGRLRHHPRHHHPPSERQEVAPSSTLRLRGGWGSCAITHPPSARRGRHHPPSDCREVGEAAPSPTLRAPGGGAIIHPPIAGRLGRLRHHPRRHHPPSERREGAPSPTDQAWGFRAPPSNAGNGESMGGPSCGVLRDWEGKKRCEVPTVCQALSESLGAVERGTGAARG
ncbi:protein mono-ADP-ribosyltransferase PARP4-like isoform X2 [Antechinus flavipes]|uniref:protein mono-ADP-ribosyltransferase PARP4-like isoform X2 n=1 Tax=Antechinus flavipes TaxID=38775 RepID=UPI0022366498|nr:protein mono-ADP-ribosyltransferase PARP4-like isoform X2 [Antechinus flavipes]